MVSWGRNRTRNFSEDYARRYIGVLAELDGQLYNQGQFFREMIDAGAIEYKAAEALTDELAAKRWDSYLGKIREFGVGAAFDEQPIFEQPVPQLGLGVTTERQRAGGGPKRKVWHLSDVARDFHEGRLTYREFLALQCMRVQLPRPKLPIDEPLRAELLSGALVRPLVLLLDALDALEAAGTTAALSEEEINRFLVPLDTHDELPNAVRQLLAARTASVPRHSAAGDRAGPASLDIWLNEFAATGYIGYLKRAGFRLVVRHLARREEARRLSETISLNRYGATAEEMDTYFEFFSASPSAEELAALRTDPSVTQLNVPSDAQLDPDTRILAGPPDTVGTLAEGDHIILEGNELADDVKAMVYLVHQLGAAQDDKLTVRLEPARAKVDGHPITWS